jgi:hypothetical protein
MACRALLLTAAGASGGKPSSTASASAAVASNTNRSPATIAEIPLTLNSGVNLSIKTVIPWNRSIHIFCS